MKDFVGNTKIFQFLKFYAMGMIQKVLSDWSEFRPIRCLESQKKNFICNSSGFNIWNLFCVTWSYCNHKGILITHQLWVITMTHISDSYIWLILYMYIRQMKIIRQGFIVLYFFIPGWVLLLMSFTYKECGHGCRDRHQ